MCAEANPFQAQSILMRYACELDNNLHIDTAHM